MKGKTPWKFIIILLIVALLSINISMTSITVAQENHDIAVVEATPYPTMVGLGLNKSVDITVVVANQGTENENFSVTVSYDSTLIEVQNVTDLTPNTNTTLNFVWDTSNVTVGTYNINATASFVLGETDVADNTLISDIKVYVVSPYITMDPQSTADTALTVGKNYTISIYTNYNGSDIWGYQFALTYNPLILKGVEVVNGDLITGGDVTFLPGDFNNAEGKLGLTAGFFTVSVGEDPNTTSGPGILANITFSIVGEGESPLELVVGTSGGTELKRGGIGDNIIGYFSNLNPDPTSGKILHGSFQNVEEIIHDVAVISLVFSPNNVTAGELVTANVTIKNKGNTIEEVEVKFYWGYKPIVGPLHLIEEVTVTLGSGENKTIGFTWDTKDAGEGTHALTAVVDLLGGVTDANLLDNAITIPDAVEVKISAGTPFPIELIIAIVVVIVALIVIYVVIRRIRK